MYPLSGYMDESECILSAGRAVLDMVEREWQPLSPGELEQRLDQALEEILEADLIARLKAQPPPATYVKLLQDQALHTSTNSPQEEETAEEMGEQPETVEDASVKVISYLPAFILCYSS